MGTPHQGGSGVHFGQVMLNMASIFVTTNDRILSHLKRDSEWLQQQLGQYAPISGDFITKFAYETYPTPIVAGKKIMVSLFYVLLVSAGLGASMAIQFIVSAWGGVAWQLQISMSCKFIQRTAQYT